jgi:hypothetical protein
MRTTVAPRPPQDEVYQEATESLLADAYLSDLVYDALLEIGEAAKASEITLEVNDRRITYPVVRRILTDSPRFITVDRLWTLSARYPDTSRPTERNLQEVVAAAGKTMSTAEMATELSAIYHRPSETYFQLLAKTLQNKDRYFRAASGGYGLTAWLPLVDAEDENDVLYDNHLTRATLALFSVAPDVRFSAKNYADATVTIVEALGDRPLPHKVVGVLAWLQLRGAYNPQEHLVACLADPRLVWLTGVSGGRWITRSHAERLAAILEERGASLSGDESEETAAPAVVSAAPVVTTTVARDAAAVAPVAVSPSQPHLAQETPAAAPASSPAPAPAHKPLEITDEDLRAIERIIAERASAVEASELLGLQYEVVPGDASFRHDVESLQQRMMADERFQYVGAGRFREPNSLPLFVYSIPEYLSFPDLQFVSLDGEIMDEEIEDEGFAGALRHETMDPLAQDVGDDEGRYTGPEPADSGRIRLVVKAHHKEIGTFPLCQVPDGFFPTDADVVEVVLRAPDGVSHDVVVNNRYRLAFNLFGLYEMLSADSGAVFFLRRGDAPFEFAFEPGAENDSQVEVVPPRLQELQALREVAEDGGDMATFDIACEVLAHYAKGLDFVQLITEVNVVRRVTRRKLASILSNYYCFVQKAGTPQWRFDAKKRDLGTDRTKRKYLKQR